MRYRPGVGVHTWYAHVSDVGWLVDLGMGSGKGSQVSVSFDGWC